MSKILVSACLLGERVRYDGVAKPVNALLHDLYQKGRIIAVCPEVDGGLPVPRLPAEIVHGDGMEVLKGQADILRTDGVSVKDAFLQGAYRALELVRKHDIKIAILKSKSPSCSSGMIYDGTFSGTLKEGAGVTTALLEKHGIKVFDEQSIEEAIEVYRKL